MRRMLNTAGFGSLSITEEKELSLPVRFYLQALLKSCTVVRMLEPAVEVLLWFTAFKNRMIAVAMK
jgi:hypothetical protein